MEIIGHKYKLELLHLIKAFGGNKELKIKSEVKNNKVITKIDDIVDIRDYKRKNDIKRSLYIVLREYYQKELKWGILTGIRPTKLAKRKTKEELVNNYFINKEKVDLIKKIIKREENIINFKNVNNNIYIGIPFCPSICNYCSFTSYNKNNYDVDNYLEALITEIKAFSGMNVDTIYIGGGTPTTLNEKQLNELLKVINKVFIEYNEFTVEAGRVDTITETKLKIMKENNVDRISINPQTMDDKTLKKIGRMTKKADIIKTYKLARKYFNNINMDIIIGLEDEKLPEIKYTLNEIKKLNPDSITMHTLALKKKSKLEKLDRKISEIDKMIDYTYAFMKKNNYNPYYLYRQKNILGGFENVGFGKPCKYNIKSIEETANIYAFGAGGVSKIIKKDKLKRIPNIRNIKEYVKRIDEMIERKR